MLTYNITNRISPQARKQLTRVIETHTKYSKGSYFWTPGGSAHNRRDNERRFERENPDVAFETRDGLLVVKLGYRESCRYCYYSSYFQLGGKKVNISTVKKALKKL